MRTASLALALLTAAGLAVVAPQPAYAANLLANPGLETGTLSPWTCSGNLGSVTAAAVHAGTKAAPWSPR